MQIVDSLNDPAFSRTVTLADAYRILVGFVEQYDARGRSTTLHLLADILLDSNGDNIDSAQFNDFLAVADKVLGKAGPVA
jgi:hypothetical protein